MDTIVGTIAETRIQNMKNHNMLKGVFREPRTQGAFT